jgi:hypothetical protein
LGTIAGTKLCTDLVVGGWGVAEVAELKANGRNRSSVVCGDVEGEMIDEMLMDGVR